jgi:hypothetical protein
MKREGGGGGGHVRACTRRLTCPLYPLLPNANHLQNSPATCKNHPPCRLQSATDWPE